MTTTATSIPTLPPVARPDIHRPLAPDLLRAEWTKLRTVRSTWWTLLAAAVAMVGLGALLTASYVARFDRIGAVDRAAFNPVAFSLNGRLLSQLAIGVLGVLVVTGEYATGTIRATFSAAPQRRSVLAAKAAVFAAVTAAVCIPASFGAFFVGQAILSAKGVEAHLGDPGVLRTVVGVGLYLTVLGLLALGLGALLRRSAGAIAAVFGLVLVLPGLAAALPSSWQDVISRYLPSNAGQAIIGTSNTHFGPSHPLSPWVGFGLFCGYAAAALVAAGFALAHRDA